jgi:hypothetical protein
MKRDLNEMDMPKLNSLRIPNKVDERNANELWELLYELEYKYSMLRFKPFKGLDQRLDNILKIIEKKSYDLIAIIAKSLIKVFGIWLESHALSDPKKWAEKRLQDEEGNWLTDVEDEIYIIEYYILPELERYSSISSFTELMMETIKEGIDIFSPSFYNDSVADIGNMLLDELEYSYDEDSYLDFIEENEGHPLFNNISNSKYKEISASYEDLRDYIKTYLSSFDEDFISLFENEEEAVAYLVESLSDFEQEHFQHLYDNGYVDISREVLLEIEEKIVFPHWFEFWSARGIVATRKNVEEVYKKLKKMKSLPLEKQFMLINIAKNTSHQNGSMMEYYDSLYNIGPVDFDRLSSRNVKDWNDELSEIGVVMEDISIQYIHKELKINETVIPHGKVIKLHV